MCTLPLDSIRMAPNRHRDLWAEYRQDRNEEARNALVLAYRSLVQDTARQLPGDLRSHWDLDDLTSAGVFGLVGAIERYAEPEDDGKFRTYARLCIKGAIFDHLRRLDWLPRRVRQRVVAYRAAESALAVSNGGHVSPEVVAASIGVPKAQLAALLKEVGSAQVLSLDLETSSPEGNEKISPASLRDFLNG